MTEAKSLRSAEQHLAPRIADDLRRLIYNGEFAPGERLNEAALALRMGTSRGPIREAVRLLVGWGLVTPVPNRGVFVRTLSVRQMLEVYELRALVFGFAAERAAERASDADKRELESMLLGMDAANDENDSTRYYELNLAFHRRILELSGNERAIQTYDEYVKELHLFRRRYFNGPGNMQRSNDQHRALFEAIARGAKARAKAVAERHVLEGRERLLSTWNADVGKP
ncbi:GntR family transcriptional regulator [Aquincola tertiaricarbonis]|uniref:GntR family transcriptional regulator n=1 Tax=Aquincola tertiaricarbonis TaxID=391953 RepID=UPI000614EBBC|nr:FCD domain-containing protein [Aquincola tertiaricarbonis]